MLYSVIIVALVVFFAIFEQVLLMRVINSTRNSEKPIELPKFEVKKRKKEPEMTEEEKMTLQILENINNYNGTSFGQTKVEVK